MTHTASSGSTSSTNISMWWPSASKATESPLLRVANLPAIARSRVPLGSWRVANSSESGCSLANVPFGSSAERTVSSVPCSIPIERMIHRGTTTQPSAAENSRMPVNLGGTSKPGGRLSSKSIGLGICPEGILAIISCSADGGSKILSASDKPAIFSTSEETACSLRRHNPANGRARGSTSIISSNPPNGIPPCIPPKRPRPPPRPPKAAGMPLMPKEFGLTPKEFSICARAASRAEPAPISSRGGRLPTPPPRPKPTASTSSPRERASAAASIGSSSSST
mmetsp:Transcript_45840/g.103256  ORF Transcript_45840/g.103256 Transcript_45840/m.103256 type:complete len:281 (+) Transcript_45840:628-1470(+)